MPTRRVAYCRSSAPHDADRQLGLTIFVRPSGAFGRRGGTLMTELVKFGAAKLPAFIAGVVFLFSFAPPVAWAPITVRRVVTVIDVCDNAGPNCASPGPAADPYFEAEADKIW